MAITEAAITGRTIQCEGKEAYDSRAFAEKVAKRRNQRDRRLSVYRCKFCRKYHMGRKRLNGVS
jgi:hypothetical protein